MHELTIHSPVSAVWQATLDLESLPDLSPTLTWLERLDSGPIEVGSAARLKQPGQRAKVWTVTTVRPEELFEWETTIAGVRTVATHRLAAVEGGCRNTLVLTLHGRGAGLLRFLAGRSMRAALAKENAGFKRKAEATARASHD